MKEDNKGKYYWIVIAVLIIIIIILLFLNECGNKKLTPTGNVDVFNIDFNCDCDGTNKCENKDKDKKDDKNNNNNYPVWHDDEDDHELNTIFVDDKSGNYLYHNHLRIFENPYYEFTNKIAPGVSNTYSFVVHNNSEINVKYYLQMYKECDYDLDLRYRLKKNGKYVLGSDSAWVSADELKTEFSRLNSGKDDKYILDWKWEYESGKDNNDTYIGENMEDVYKLNVKFYFEQV